MSTNPILPLSIHISSLPTSLLKKAYRASLIVLLGLWSIYSSVHILMSSSSNQLSILADVWLFLIDVVVIFFDGVLL